MANWFVSSTRYATVTARANSTAYVIGDIRKQGPGTPTLGQERVFRCTTAGTSGATEPTSSVYIGTSTTHGGTVTDGTVTWTDITGNSTYGWTSPAATLTGLLLQGTTAGDTVYVASDHAESSSTQPKTPGTVGSNTASVRVVSVNPANDPPTALQSGATITYTGGGMTGVGQIGYIDYYGITFSATTIEFFNSAYGRQTFTDCNFVLTGSGTTGIVVGQGNGNIPTWVDWNNVTVKFSATGQVITFSPTASATASYLSWRGGSIDSAGSAPTTLFSGATSAEQGLLRVQGVDLSALGSGKNLVNLANIGTSVTLVDCKLGASVSVTTGAANQANPEVTLVNCDSSATAYRYFHLTGQGTETHETTIVRTGGASDGTTTVSRKVVTTALADDTLYTPYRSLPVEYWNTTTSGTATLTIACITDNVTLTDNDLWLEVEYPGSAASPLGTWASSRMSDVVFGTPSNLTTDSTSTWTTTGLTTPVKQKVSVSITPKAIGLVRVYINARKASTTLYYDPLVQVS